MPEYSGTFVVWKAVLIKFKFPNEVEPVGLYRCRERVNLSTNPRVVLKVEAGAVLEQVHIEGIGRSLFRVLGVGSLLYRGALVPSKLQHFSVAHAIHLNGAQLNHCFYDLDQLHRWHQQDLIRVRKQMVRAIYYSAYYRIVHELVELAEYLGQDGQDGWVILPLKLTIQELANCVCTSRETASAAVTRLQQQRLVRLENQVFSLDLINLIPMLIQST